MNTPSSPCTSSVVSIYIISKKKKKRNKEGKEEDRRRFNKREVEDTMWYGLGETSFGTELSPTA